MTRIAVIGSLLVDMTIRTDRLPVWGDNLRDCHFHLGAGGKGANAATTIARMGGQAVMIGCLGDDELAQRELDTLSAEGVDVKAVKRLAGSSTAVAMILLGKNGETARLIADQVNPQLSAEMVEDALDPNRGSLDAILINFEASAAAIQTAVRIGRSRHIPVVIDAGPVMNYTKDVWGNATLLTPNLPEAEALVGFSVTDDRSALDAGRQLLQAGPEAVVIKMGSKGALIVSREIERAVPAFPVHAVDTSGAGDAFGGSLTLALAEGQSLEEAVHLAVAAGSTKVTRLGTLNAMPTRREVEQLLS